MRVELTFFSIVVWSRFIRENCLMNFTASTNLRSRSIFGLYIFSRLCCRMCVCDIAFCVAREAERNERAIKSNGRNKERIMETKEEEEGEEEMRVFSVQFKSQSQCNPIQIGQDKDSETKQNQNIMSQTWVWKSQSTLPSPFHDTVLLE